MRNDLHEANRLSWNAATVAHNSHKGGQAAFFRAGGSTFYPEELDLLGEIAGLEVGFERCATWAAGVWCRLKAFRACH
ncbi:hypothetical protein BC364_23875 [Ensifer sp. LC499]|nr:hypothetical protein BC364_23875 [Ensifer sp. LC499]